MKSLNKIIEELVEENEILKNECDYWQSEFRELINETDDYIEKLKSDINYQNNEKLNYLLENNKLKNELFNAYLKQQHQERLILELKTALSSYNNFVDVMFPD